MKTHLLCFFVLLFALLSTASDCNASHRYVSSSISGHFGCDGYTNMITISWLIELPDTTERILLEFDSFNTEDGYDFIKIYDGNNENAPLLGSFSGSYVPGPFPASGNSIFIVFASDQYVTGTGFSAHWSQFQIATGISRCSENQQLSLIGPEGDFGCAGYANSLLTSWHITGNVGERIVLSFDIFSTERNFDLVKIYNMPSTPDNLIGTYSGSDIPPPITSNNNELFITFESDYSLNDRGFTASWTSLVEFADPCFNSTSQILIPFEGYLGCPYGYGNNVHSTWLIHVVGDMIIQLDFLSLNLESGRDFVEVYDGANTQAAKLGNFTGLTTPSTIRSTSNQMLVALRTDQQNTAGGFTASYQTGHALQQSGCSSTGSFTLTSAQDSIGCDGYLDGVTEEWLILSQSKDDVIALTWSRFDTEVGRDFLSVYDGNSAASPLLYTVSGSSIPDPVVSSGTTLFVKFVADSNRVRGTGFAGLYESVPKVDPLFCSSNHQYVLTAESGDFGCSGYSESVSVSWQIHVQNGDVILLQWNSFFTESGSDIVTVYDGPNASAQVLTSWSGTFRPPVLSSASNYLFVQFSSDSSIQRQGFSASYSSVYTGHNAVSCYTNENFILTDDSNTFGCEGYGPSVDSSWAITTSPSTVINLEFTQFQTEQQYDFVTIHDGPNQASPILASYSGYLVPSPLHSSSNSLFITFHSDSSMQYDGFVASYSAQSASSVAVKPCTTSTTQTLTDRSGQFGCDHYSNNIDSSWTINGHHGQKISLTFTLMRTELFYDLVKIYDGSNASAHLLGTFSGTSTPGSFTSSGSNIFVTFHSDSSSSSEYAGFVIEYVQFGSFDSPCTDSGFYALTGDSGNFGCNGYSDSVTVTWSIHVSGSVYITFNSFDTEYNYDFLSVYDGPNINSPLIAHYSGSTIPPGVASSTGSVCIVFSSDASTHKHGFTATYGSLVTIDPLLANNLI